MNKFEKLLWKLKVNYHRRMMALLTIAGREDLANREYKAVEAMVATYYVNYLKEVRER